MFILPRDEKFHGPDGYDSSSVVPLRISFYGMQKSRWKFMNRTRTFSRNYTDLYCQPRFYLFSFRDTFISSVNFILMQLAFCFARDVTSRKACSNHITYNGSVSRVVTAYRQLSAHRWQLNKRAPCTWGRGKGSCKPYLRNVNFIGVLSSATWHREVRKMFTDVPLGSFYRLHGVISKNSHRCENLKSRKPNLWTLYATLGSEVQKIWYSRI